MERLEIIKCIDANITIKNPVHFAEKNSSGFLFNIFSDKMLTEISGSDPSKIIRIAIFSHKNQDGLWDGNMSSEIPHILYGYYDFSTKQIDYVWQKELQCRMCEGETYFKSCEDKGIGKVIRLIYIDYP